MLVYFFDFMLKNQFRILDEMKICIFNEIIILPCTHRAGPKHR